MTLWERKTKIGINDLLFQLKGLFNKNLTDFQSVKTTIVQRKYD